ncbi:MAG TPA: RNase adapter RapZ, partial [Propionibacteriaceae bacterium]|nr:RNase adapter RapZ [Propionibacteriaceae bacterium]
PNPHWVPELRPMTGLSDAVRDYVLSADGASEFLDLVESLIGTMKPGYVREGKRQATVAIGCTGGKHRSTAMTEELARRLRVDGVTVSVMHRDLGKE